MKDEVMRYWFDTEFIERGHTEPIRLLSIGIVAEDGRELYAERRAALQMIAGDLERYSDPWLTDNVAPHLGKQPQCQSTFTEIGHAVREFVGDDKRPEFWAYYADYDWVVFCQLFGSMIHLPNGWPMYCRDVKQLCDDLGNPQLPTQTASEHHALHDARWTREAWEYLQDLKSEKRGR